MKSNLKEGDLEEDRDQIWWNQVKADIRKIGMAEEDLEDMLKLRGFVGAAKMSAQI